MSTHLAERHLLDGLLNPAVLGRNVRESLGAEQAVRDHDRFGKVRREGGVIVGDRTKPWHGPTATGGRRAERIGREREGAATATEAATETAAAPEEAALSRDSAEAAGASRWRNKSSLNSIFFR